MKLMIASDIHGSAYYCREMLHNFEVEGAERLLLLGDILYHGRATTCRGTTRPKRYWPCSMPAGKRFSAFAATGDTEVDQMVLDFPILADYCVLFAGNRLIYATHGHHFNRQTPPLLQRGDILLHGHTHVPSWDRFGEDNFCLNPGSVSLPKEGSAHGYMILTDAQAAWKDLEGKTYHTLAL